MRRFAPTPLARLEPSRGLQWVAGVLSGLRTLMTRRGKMLYASLDDGSAQLEVAIFNELYEQHRHRLKEDHLIIIQGKVSNDEYSGGLRVSAESLFDLQLARESRAKALRITLAEPVDTQRLHQVLGPYRSHGDVSAQGVAVELEVRKSPFECRVRLGDEWRVRMADALFNELSDWVSPDNVEITY